MKKLLIAFLCSWLITLPAVAEQQQEIPTVESLQAQYPGCVVTEEYVFDYSIPPEQDSTTVLQPQPEVLGCIILVVVVAVVFWGVTIYIIYRICVPPSPPAPPVTNSAPNTPYPA